MPKLQVSIGIRANPRTQAIIDGSVSIEGVEAVASVLEPSELYWRVLAFDEFDIAELSLSSYLAAVDSGRSRWIALPVFTNRRFFHTDVLVRDDAGIRSPADLAGKRLGVVEYQQTGAIFTRGILQSEFGFDPRSAEWYMERSADFSHGAATGFAPPDGIKLTFLSAETSLGEVLSRGEIDGTITYNTMHNLVDRSRVVFGEGSGVRPLFDRRAESARYFAKTGFFPMNGVVVIRRSVVEHYPWVALNVYSAYLAAKDKARALAQADLPSLLDAGVADQEVARAMEFDLFPYGVTANRRLLEIVARYSFEQGLTSRELSLEELFYEGALQL